MKKLGTVLAVLLSLCMSVCVWADAGKAQNVDYKTDYYMIVESPDGGVDLYSEGSADSTKLNDELIPNGTAIHVEGESKDESGKVWLYTQLHGMYGFLQENYMKPATLAEAVASELKLFGSEEVNYSIKVAAKEDGSVSLYKGPGEKYGTVSGGCGIANGESLYIDTEVDTGKDGLWGHTSAGDVTGWVNIGKATNTEKSAVELIPENSGDAADLDLTPVPGQESAGRQQKAVKEEQCLGGDRYRFTGYCRSRKSRWKWKDHSITCGYRHSYTKAHQYPDSEVNQHPNTKANQYAYSKADQHPDSRAD